MTDIVSVKGVGARSANISWQQPVDADCTGELIGYEVLVNSSHSTGPVSIKLPRTNTSHLLEDRQLKQWVEAKLDILLVLMHGCHEDAHRSRHHGALKMSM
ncbi:unnamed protein product [Protopolystoma xenopodis]|uniref:Uncharacterized protein n=1 Tax=Protopolystoma xenopodis TaxID=117903 RepID=A0A3S5CQ49_9PLAT|nr:unnamed protein product [Protopolystoma xenopodis]